MLNKICLIILSVLMVTYSAVANAEVAEKSVLPVDSDKNTEECEAPSPGLIYKHRVGELNGNVLPCRNSIEIMATAVYLSGGTHQAQGRLAYSYHGEKFTIETKGSFHEVDSQSAYSQSADGRGKVSFSVNYEIKLMRSAVFQTLIPLRFSKCLSLDHIPLFSTARARATNGMSNGSI